MPGCFNSRIMQIEYIDEKIIVCVKPAGILSTDEPGGLPELVRNELGDERADVRTVHRLDRVVSGLVVLARGSDAASELSRQIREGDFGKGYLAVVHGRALDEGSFEDLMYRDKAERKSYVTLTPAKGVQEAKLNYRCLGRKNGLSLVSIELITGRTHQIRCQFSHHGLPLVGDRKYSLLDDGCDIALWSERLSFFHPADGRPMSFEKAPPRLWPWELF